MCVSWSGHIFLRCAAPCKQHFVMSIKMWFSADRFFCQAGILVSILKEHFLSQKGKLGRKTMLSEIKMKYKNWSYIKDVLLGSIEHESLSLALTLLFMDVFLLLFHISTIDDITQKLKFTIRVFFSKCEIPNGKPHFLCSVVQQR